MTKRKKLPSRKVLHRYRVLGNAGYPFAWPAGREVVAAEEEVEEGTWFRFYLDGRCVFDCNPLYAHAHFRFEELPP